MRTQWCADRGRCVGECESVIDSRSEICRIQRVETWTYQVVILRGKNTAQQDPLRLYDIALTDEIFHHASSNPTVEPQCCNTRRIVTYLGSKEITSIGCKVKVDAIADLAICNAHNT